MKIVAVGLGPGAENEMTGRALDALRESDVIVGYETYISLLGSLAEGKTVLTTPMRQEVDRCKLAIEETLKGKTVAVVCSGDAGIYGMAGLLQEVAAEHPQIEIEVVPGVTAATSAAAVLGAPLSHDFAVVSLSDLLTPWETIAKRLKCAAEADFVLCLYNPASRKRSDYLARACAIVSEFRGGDTPCGYARNIGRVGQEHHVLTLRELAAVQADMFTTVIIGNSTTKIIGGRLVTPRGYRGI
ncbi:MAG: precorrin-3B C(17)-methyltransferase [Ethanoligenens sp.]